MYHNCIELSDDLRILVKLSELDTILYLMGIYKLRTWASSTEMSLQYSVNSSLGTHTQVIQTYISSNNMFIIRKEGSDNYLYLFSELQVIRIYIRRHYQNKSSSVYFFLQLLVLMTMRIPQIKIRNNFYFYQSCLFFFAQDSDTVYSRLSLDLLLLLLFTM